MGWTGLMYLTHVLMDWANMYLLHHNPQLYPSFFEYRPERFSTENCSKRHPFAFIPFSGGPRSCLGKIIRVEIYINADAFNDSALFTGHKYSMAEMKTTLAKISRHFTVKTADPAWEDLDVVLEIVTRPINGIRVQFKPRSHHQ